MIKQYPRRQYLQPMTSTSHLTLINDHVLKENLSQRTTLKCKTPRMGSALSRSTTYGGNEDQKTSRPLQVFRFALHE